ncbi:MAG: SRPBCC family protein [bacterium]|nr:SRPBCC family protein [bacterium]
MGIVISEIDINSDPQKVFKIASQVEKFPDYMPDVKKVELIDRKDDGYSRTSWVALAKIASINNEIKWIEDEWWDSGTLSSKFEQVEGDYKHYHGDWAFTKTADGTHVKLTVDYDLGLPLIGPMIFKLLDNLTRNNLDSMLKAIKERAEGNMT